MSNDILYWQAIAEERAQALDAERAAHAVTRKALDGAERRIALCGSRLGFALQALLPAETAGSDIFGRLDTMLLSLTVDPEPPPPTETP